MGIFCRFLLITGLFLCSVTAQTVHYSENFEGSIPNMTVTGGGWEFGVTTNVGPTTIPEGSRCAGTVLAGNYVDNARYMLTTPTISLPDSAVIKLSFHEWYSLESCCDYIYLEIEQNNSGTWDTLRTRISGTVSSWNMKNFDLSTYRNSNIRLRFRLTNEVIIVYPGWYIDLVQVYSPVIKSLAVSSSGNRTTAPTGTDSIETSAPYNITATPNSGYHFSNWTVECGSATIANSNLQSTTVQISGNATIRANHEKLSFN